MMNADTDTYDNNDTGIVQKDLKFASRTQRDLQETHHAGTSLLCRWD